MRADCILTDVIALGPQGPKSVLHGNKHDEFSTFMEYLNLELLLVSHAAHQHVGNTIINFLYDVAFYLWPTGSPDSHCLTLSTSTSRASPSMLFLLVALRDLNHCDLNLYLTIHLC